MGTDASLCTILVVEDDAHFARLIQKRLGRKGYEVNCAASGTEAIDLVRNEQNILMLLDYNLPDMNAAEVVSRLTDEGICVPFVVITGQGSEAVAVEMMKLGAMDYIVKNTSFLDLLPAVVNRATDEIVMQSQLAAAQEALRKEKTHLLNNIPDMVFQIDSEGKFISLNPAVTAILGYHPGEMLDKPLAKFLHRDDVAHVKRDHEAVKNGQQMLRHPIRFMHKDGSARWLEGNIVAIYDQQQNPTGLSAIYKDITQEKIASDELKEAEERIRLLADTSPSMVLELDLDFKLISMNKAGITFFHFEDDSQFLGSYCIDLFGSQWVEPVRNAMKDAGEGRTVKTTAEITNFCGRLHWFDIIFSPVRNAAGRVVSILATAWDVSERVQREQTIRQSLQRKDRLAREATILQTIALSAGTGMTMDPAEVVKTAMNSVFVHIDCNIALGYIFDENDRLSRISETENITPELRSHFDGFFSQAEVIETIRRLRTPRTLSQTPIDLIAGSDATLHEMFEATAIVPFVNAGISYGFLIFVSFDKESLHESMEFFHLVSNCGGLAMANARAFQGTSSHLKGRMLHLESCSNLGLVSADREQMNDALGAIVESGINLVSARSGLVLLHNKPAATLYGTAGAGLSAEDVRSVVLTDGQSLPFKCLQHKRAMFCQDISAESDLAGEAIANLTRKTLLCVPLLDSNDDVVGVLAICDQSEKFDVSHMNVLEAFGRLAAQTVNNARLLQKASDLDQKLVELCKISRTIITERDIDAVLWQICQGAVEVLDAEMAWIGVVPKGSVEIKYTARAGRGGEWLEQAGIACCDSDDGLCPTATAIHKGHPVSVNNIMANVRLRDLAEDHGLNSCCAVPIMSKSEVIGALTLFRSEPDMFSPQNVTVLQEFADQAAIALTNVKLRRTLVESESLKEIILQSVNDALVVVDWTGSVVSANGAAEKLFRRHSSRLKNCPYTDVLGENNTVAEVTAEWLNSRTVETDVQGWVQLENRRKIFVSVEMKNIALEQMPCLLLTITDLTMQKKMNASLEHAAKLTTVGRIATQIAHEIGNPLTLISSQIQRMVQEDNPDTERLAGLLSHVDRIAGLIRRFSDLGRKDPLVTQPESIGPIIENLLSLVAHTIPFEGIDIEKRLDPNLPAVNIDRNKITQVLLNLLLNGADACQGRGRIVISNSQKQVPIEVNNERTVSDYVLISIRDDGCGIEPDTLKRIFEPFYTSKEVGSGIGLGLSMSLAIIDQHHGWINVDSKVDRGSTFSVYLPVKEAPLATSTRQIKSIDYSSPDVEKHERV